MKDLTGKHGIWEQKIVHWRPYFIALQCFNGVETCILYTGKTLIILENINFLKKFITQIIDTFAWVDHFLYKNACKSFSTHANQIFLSRNRLKLSP